MSVRMECACGYRKSLTEFYAGKRVTCPDCGATVSLPASSKVYSIDNLPSFSGDLAPRSAPEPMASYRASPKDQPSSELDARDPLDQAQTPEERPGEYVPSSSNDDPRVQRFLAKMREREEVESTAFAKHAKSSGKPCNGAPICTLFLMISLIGISSVASDAGMVLGLVAGGAVLLAVAARGFRMMMTWILLGGLIAAGIYFALVGFEKSHLMGYDLSHEDAHRIYPPVVDTDYVYKLAQTDREPEKVHLVADWVESDSANPMDTESMAQEELDVLRYAQGVEALLLNEWAKANQRKSLAYTRLVLGESEDGSIDVRWITYGPDGEPVEAFEVELKAYDKVWTYEVFFVDGMSYHRRVINPEGVRYKSTAHIYPVSQAGEFEPLKFVEQPKY